MSKYYEKVQIADIDTQIEYAIENPEHWTEHEMKWILDNVAIVSRVRATDPRYFWYYKETDIHQLYDFYHSSDKLLIPVEKPKHPIYRGTQLPKKAYCLVCFNVELSDDIQLHIYKAHDEWFYIQSSYRPVWSEYWTQKLDQHYKCDGFRGLKQALTDMGVVKQVVPKKGLIAKFKDFFTK